MEEVLKVMLQTQQQANANQQQSNANQQQTNQLLIAQINAQAEASKVTLEQQQQVNLHLQQCIQALAERLQGSTALVQAPINIRKAVQRSLQKMTPADDVEAYLAVFERVAAREKLPPEEWAEVVAPYLTGEPQKVYYDLKEQDSHNYNKLKEEILVHLGVTLAVHAKRFNEWVYTRGKSARVQMHDLLYLTRKWLQPDLNTADQVVERIVVERYRKALPRDLQRWVGQADPQDMTQMVELVERFVATEGYLGEGVSPQHPGKAQRLQENPGKTVPFLKGVVSQSNRDRNSGMATGLNSGAKPRVVPSQRQEASDRERRGVQCFRCWEFGHFAANCPLTTEPMDCSWGRRKSLYAHPACLASQQEETGKQFCLVGIKGQQVSALLDSGSLVTLVCASLVDTTDSLNSRVGVMCIHRDTKEYPTAVVMIETPCGNVKYQVGVVKNLMHAVILGRDFPLFWQLWGRGSNTEKGSPREAEEPDLSTEPFTSGDSAGEVGVTPDISSPLEVFAGLGDEVQEGDVVPDLEVSRDNFGTAQMRDPTLCKAREGVKEINGEPQFPGAESVFPRMVLNQDLLYQVSKIRGEIIEQLVVPQQYRRVVLDMAHRHVLGGHLGVDKTADRVLQRFFWPGVAGDVKRYCNSCPDCQINAPKPHYRGPLVPLPIIEVPF
uniref:Gypsy retrotransposon integrase-like protein 1 n=1 Tax=Xenopus tropicalis TaxID=8364 RepID=A0A803KFP0_XENTR